MRMQTLGNNNNNFLLNNKFNLALERTRGGTAPPLLWQLYLRRGGAVAAVAAPALRVRGS
eukprot:CAMPEP_0194780806 /NCGR_PEP_ID=MMETSP0323_2-20130528/74527_1 /TAXON_ID=2866 ORGANISM="Crypthecodinium cohnii, Strain Seligo" /NCGR_SAMPLE_ID=MMETSP0323_2 /ASSEMBLY_ACC=CAM_ASM_000346 /LENGTH=59 /DNA_ID=CAMNT_0039718919 /DNA_START=222 /DNA_END=399 /DNA_ORIENTATION=+